MHLCTASIAKVMNVYVEQNVSIVVCVCVSVCMYLRVAQAISASQSSFGADVQAFINDRCSFSPI